MVLADNATVVVLGCLLSAMITAIRLLRLQRKADKLLRRIDRLESDYVALEDVCRALASDEKMTRAAYENATAKLAIVRDRR